MTQTVTFLAPESAHTLEDIHLLSDEEIAAEMEALVEASVVSARRWACDVPDCDGLTHEGWLHRHARASQRIPPGSWSIWLIMAGRGWGKTRTASETVREWAKEPGIQIAVVAKKETLVREICFESPKSGLLSVIPKEEILSYARTPGGIRLRLRNGTTIWGFGAEVPDNLRGWAFDKAWCDEYAAWNRKTAQETYDMLWFCLREARQPQVILSTTPKPLPHIRRLIAERDEERAANIAAKQAAAEAGLPEPETTTRIVVTAGHTDENRGNLSADALRVLHGSYDGTRQGRQELSGELLMDVEGALWQGWMFDIEGFRIDPRVTQIPYLDRLVVSVDPAVKSTENADLTAFTVAGRSQTLDATYADGLPRAYVLYSEQGRFTPEKAMRRAADLYHQFQADAVVIEANNGGEYLPTVLTMVDPTVPPRLVHASRNKRARATPVSTLYERGRVHHVGPAALYDALEQQMLTYVGIGDDDDEKSPDLLDSMVWALTDLLLDPATAPAGTTIYRDERLPGR